VAPPKAVTEGEVNGERPVCGNTPSTTRLAPSGPPPPLREGGLGTDPPPPIARGLPSARSPRHDGPRMHEACQRATLY